MKTAIALGTFDGVHIGHKAVLQTAANSGLTSIAVAFRIPPKAYFQNEGVILTREDRKTALIKDIGIKQVEYLDFNKVKDISPEDFFDYLYKTFSPALIVCGYNYTFGKGGKGNTELLKKLCEQKEVELKVIDKVSVDEQPVSSSYIRKLLKDGKTSDAVKLLPDGFFIEEIVLHGDKRGREMSFPTFNQYYSKDMAAVKYGVYMTKAIIDGKAYFGMTNIGIRPTFPLDAPLCETNLFDFSGELYSKTIRLYLLRFIREEKKFSSLEELKTAIYNDKQQILRLLRGEK